MVAVVVEVEAVEVNLLRRTSLIRLAVVLSLRPPPLEPPEEEPAISLQLDEIALAVVVLVVIHTVPVRLGHKAYVRGPDQDSRSDGTDAETRASPPQIVSDRKSVV